MRGRKEEVKEVDRRDSRLVAGVGGTCYMPWSQALLIHTLQTWNLEIRELGL
ncbi:conserved hypothetical protein [Ricinus communis]|uniref:Uncharacterized protein n=1 Tax=Ricinus communis TaxID=3988 RepID=B9RUK0_RICCO|nr:conserved hypothetical protein [Ricinus communis]